MHFSLSLGLYLINAIPVLSASLSVRSNTASNLDSNLDGFNPDLWVLPEAEGTPIQYFNPDSSWFQADARLVTDSSPYPPVANSRPQGSQDTAVDQYSKPPSPGRSPSMMADTGDIWPVVDLKGGALAGFLGLIELISEGSSGLVNQVQHMVNADKAPGVDEDAPVTDYLARRLELCPPSRFRGRVLAVCDYGNPLSIWYHVYLDMIILNQVYPCLGPGLCVDSIQEYWCCQDWSVRWPNTATDCLPFDDWRDPGTGPFRPYTAPEWFGRTWPEKVPQSN